MRYFYSFLLGLFCLQLAAQKTEKRPSQTEFQANFMLIQPILEANNLENNPEFSFGTRLSLLKSKPLGEKIRLQAGISLMTLSLKQEHLDRNREGEIFRTIKPEANLISLGVPLHFSYHPFSNKFYLRGGGQLIWNALPSKTAEVFNRGSLTPPNGQGAPFLSGDFSIAPFITTLDIAIGFRQDHSHGGYSYIDVGISRSLGRLVKYAQDASFGTLRYMDDAAIFMLQITAGGTFNKR